MYPLRYDAIVLMLVKKLNDPPPPPPGVVPIAKPFENVIAIFICLKGEIYSP
jgi:hypothetical protein